MALLDLMNWVGRRKWLRPLGLILLLFITRFRFATMVNLAGRRMVCAPAGAPAIVLTQTDMKKALNNSELLFNAMRFTVDRMGFDTLNMMVDMSIEAEACGCQIQYRDRSLPDVVSHPAKTLEDIIKLRVPDPHRDGRLPVFIETMRLMKRNYTMLKSAIVVGPFTLAMLLAGSEIYVDIRKNPQKVKTLLEYCQKMIISYGQALIDAGADLMVIAEPMGSQLSPAQYKEFSQPYVQNITKTFRKPCGLHICGKAGHIVNIMAESGAVFLSIDDVDIQSLAGTIRQPVVLMGNISPTKLKINSPEEIKKTTRNLLEVTRGRKGFIVGPGCDLAPETPLENITAFVKRVKKWKPASSTENIKQA
jgi:MtaA/CmuA family methyltransferase